MGGPRGASDPSVLQHHKLILVRSPDSTITRVLPWPWLPPPPHPTDHHKFGVHSLARPGGSFCKNQFGEAADAQRRRAGCVAVDGGFSACRLTACAHGSGAGEVTVASSHAVPAQAAGVVQRRVHRRRHVVHRHPGRVHVAIGARALEHTCDRAGGRSGRGGVGRVHTGTGYGTKGMRGTPPRRRRRRRRRARSTSRCSGTPTPNAVCQRRGGSRAIAALPQEHAATRDERREAREARDRESESVSPNRRSLRRIVGVPTPLQFARQVARCRR